MVGEPFDLLGQPVGIERLEGLDDTGMQGPPPVLEQAAIGHLLRQRVLEGVCEFGEQARLIQKLGAL